MVKAIWDEMRYGSLPLSGMNRRGMMWAIPVAPWRMAIWAVVMTRMLSYSALGMAKAIGALTLTARGTAVESAPSETMTVMVSRRLIQFSFSGVRSWMTPSGVMKKFEAMDSGARIW